ncbi:TPA: hypothetical protein LC278_004598, partial [Salmonella enterica subsp. enterica serovar Michigan]|nr:hypothetical protein [Salmonella enterica subsp. enterica serovar Muenchen]EIK9629476.1 hypothetical protein [Salmonella enterica subsp. enterica serovar Newport]HBJ6473027.1 hypothetical protein [Salmonella enterica subsp. enterica serovar Michigan]
VLLASKTANHHGKLESQQFIAWRHVSMPVFASISPVAAATGGAFLLAYCNLYGKNHAFERGFFQRAWNASYFASSCRAARAKK